MQDAPAQGSASAAHAGVRIRGLDNGVALFVSSGEVRAAGCEPSGALRRQLPPGLYSVAAENAAVGALAGKAEVILVTSARFSRVRLQGPSQELDVENCDTRQLGIGNVAAAAWGDPACKSGV
jgi:hypothetical protein